MPGQGERDLPGRRRPRLSFRRNVSLPRGGTRDRAFCRVGWLRPAGIMERDGRPERAPARGASPSACTGTDLHVPVRHQYLPLLIAGPHRRGCFRELRERAHRCVSASAGTPGCGAAVRADDPHAASAVGLEVAPPRVGCCWSGCCLMWRSSGGGCRDHRHGPERVARGRAGVLGTDVEIGGVSPDLEP